MNLSNTNQPQNMAKKPKQAASVLGYWTHDAGYFCYRWVAQMEFRYNSRSQLKQHDQKFYISGRNHDVAVTSATKNKAPAQGLISERSGV